LSRSTGTLTDETELAGIDTSEKSGSRRSSNKREVQHVLKSSNPSLKLEKREKLKEKEIEVG